MGVSTEWWRRLWIGVALAICALLAAVTYQFLGTVVLGLFLYYAARPIYDRLDGRVRPPNLAAAAALLCLVLPVILLFWYAVALGLEELGSLSNIDPSQYERLVGPYLSDDASASDLSAVVETAVSDPRSLLESGRIRDVLGVVGGVLSAVLGGLVRVFVAGVIAFYLLRDDERLAAWVHETADDDLFSRYARTVDDDLQTVFFGNILLAILTGIIAAGTFVALDGVAPPSLGVPAPILFGLLAGAGSLVPAVGTKLVYGPMAVYIAALAATTDPDTLWFPAVFVVVTGVIVDVIPDIVIRPYVSGRHLHVGLVMLAYIFGPLVFGWYGLFLGPLLLVVGVHFAEIVLPELLDRGQEDDEDWDVVDESGDDLPAESASVDEQLVTEAGETGGVEDGEHDPPGGERAPDPDSGEPQDTDGETLPDGRSSEVESGDGET